MFLPWGVVIFENENRGLFELAVTEALMYQQITNALKYTAARHLSPGFKYALAKFYNKAYLNNSVTDEASYKIFMNNFKRNSQYLYGYLFVFNHISHSAPQVMNSF